MRGMVLFGVSLVLFLQLVKAQDREGYYWIRYLNQLSTGKWQINTDVDNRRFFSPHEQKQLLLRTVGLYKFSDRVKAGLGFAYSRTYESDKDNFSVPELRPFQQLELSHKVGRLDFDHRLRTEQRFVKETFQQQLLDSYDFTFRTRYRIQAGYSLAKKEKEKGHVALQLREEVFVNLSNAKETFDQNRLYGGVVFQPLKPIALELGYMWWHQNQDAEPDENGDVLRFTLRHYIE